MKKPKYKIKKHNTNHGLAKVITTQVVRVRSMDHALIMVDKYGLSVE